ncbi:MAG TPA: GNAT family N-acetyltransferase [Pyrinomonadaceae bacterium]|jgi:N-acetylglutamate synthase-like GNAT family acetyltransferase|nr:GNAT family N-acetyltransferase [Pyrinomonadaceae bacterium]
MISVRPAAENDIDALCSLDLIAQSEDERREFIRGEVVSGNCFVAAQDEKIIGYGVLNYTFHHTGCIDMLYIDSGHRRSGAGAALVQHMESLCQTSHGKLVRRIPGNYDSAIRIDCRGRDPGK